MKLVGRASPHRRRRFTVVLLLAVGFLIVALLDYLQPQQVVESPQTLSVQSVPQELRVSAIESLGKLAVKDRVSLDGYARDKFSPGWAEVAGCDMRNRILQRDLQEVVLDDDNCTVLSGVLPDDPFTAQTIPFQRGRETSGDIHIEHIVAVSDAWQKGAQQLDYKRRQEFYNDPLILIAVDGASNMEKGDKDAADWLPHERYRCQYVARQIAIKLEYDLWVTRNEHNAIKRVLQTCPGQILPVVGDF
ncbi:MAG: HNH endonuclease family protein [Candidatus Saccharibacteria bacterium]|nr:HNH endonuclease family protein [Candidatus Saccharibacteria bacterium]